LSHSHTASNFDLHINTTIEYVKHNKSTTRSSRKVRGMFAKLAKPVYRQALRTMRATRSL